MPSFGAAGGEAHPAPVYFSFTKKPYKWAKGVILVLMVCSTHKEATDLEGEIYCPNCGVVFGYVTKEEATINDDGQSNIGPPTNRHSLPDYVRLGSAPLKAPKGKYWLKFP
jgi:hypothetical protein